MPRRPGQISSRQKCKLCGSTKYNLRDGWLWCAVCGQFPATSFEIILRWRGSTLRLGYDQYGRRLGSYPDAEAALALIRKDIEAEVFEPRLWSSPKHNFLLWENYLGAYLRREEKRLGKASYLTRRPQIMRLAKAFAGHNLRDLRNGHIEDWVNGPLRDTGLSPRSRHHLCVVLRGIFRWAVERQDIKRAPRVPMPQVPQGVIEWIMPEEQAAVLSKIPGEHRPIFEFLFAYGCRVSEACALMWDCVDRVHGVITFRRTISAGEVVERTKTGQARVEPLFAVAREVLDRLPKGVGATPVFRNPRGRGDRLYNKISLSRIWRRALEASGRPHIKLKNATRHSAGMYLLNHVPGATPADVAALLGHRDARTTARYYARPEIARLRRLLDGAAVNRLSIPQRGVNQDS